MKRDEKIKQKLLDEISNSVGFKLCNLKNGTINQMEKQALFESIAFLNMINYSSMPISEIKKHWDKSNLAFI